MFLWRIPSGNHAVPYFWREKKYFYSIGLYLWRFFVSQSHYSLLLERKVCFYSISLFPWRFFRQWITLFIISEQITLLLFLWLISAMYFRQSITLFSQEIFFSEEKMCFYSIGFSLLRIFVTQSHYFIPGRKKDPTFQNPYLHTLNNQMAWHDLSQQNEHTT